MKTSQEGSASLFFLPVFSPLYRYRIFWDMLSLLCVSYNLIIMPFRLAFEVINFPPDPLWCALMHKSKPLTTLE